MTNYRDVLASPQRPKIGVVLSSGGIRPFGAVELFKFFEEAHIPIDLIVGCSGGSIAGALKGMGLTIPQILDAYKILMEPKAFANINYHTLAGILEVPFIKYYPEEALLKPDFAKELVHKVFGGHRLENLPIKTVLQTTNGRTGEGMLLTQGDLDKAVYASSALMPFFPPIHIDGNIYFDGVYSSTFPLMEAVYRNMDIIIGMDFSFYPYPLTNIFDCYVQLINESLKNSTSLQNSLAIQLHHYEIIIINVEFPKLISLWETDLLHEVLENTKVNVERNKEKIINAIELFPLSQKIREEEKKKMSVAEPWYKKLYHTFFK